ncbi:hypothetical protein NDU88_001021 [Pleurodeles waltl]|uniref:Uncharacterized protein n=1 Tax=Pleurodeles waltl TaxID=8319 RepID=A0AAV7LWE5_PLEWA|nr:hypothetical protein NDU88_001021 [Pleurodeles waltl]
MTVAVRLAHSFQGVGEGFSEDGVEGVAPVIYKRMNMRTVEPNMCGEHKSLILGRKLTSSLLHEINQGTNTKPLRRGIAREGGRQSTYSQIIELVFNLENRLDTILEDDLE